MIAPLHPKMTPPKIAPIATATAIRIRVVPSIPAASSAQPARILADAWLESLRPGRLAQLGEHQLDKLGVTGSSPVPPIRRSKSGTPSASHDDVERLVFSFGAL